MTFTVQQVRKLKASVGARHVRAREIDGKTLHYLEGWHVICEANRIFGFDAWDRETVSSECVWRTQVEGQFAAAYLTRVRIRVRAGEAAITREGIGSGEAIAPSPGQAHERAAKAAETDATKRALSTFGNSFGLSLYRDRGEAPKVSPAQTDNAAHRAVKAVARVLRATERLDTSEDRRAARLLNRAPQHLSDDRLPNRCINEPTSSSSADEENDSPEANEPASDRSSIAEATPQQGFVTAHLPVRLPSVDKSVLTLAEPKRRRDREHLKFVASQPCVICARTPSEAHHLRIAQPRALGRKVSDEFTVPLCALHHRDVHAKGNEQEWWWGHATDPLLIAQRLWLQSRDRGA